MKSLSKTSIGLVLINLFNLSLQLGRDVFIAGKVGLDARTDAFFVVIALPVLLSSILERASKAIIIPALSRHLLEGDRETVSKLVGGLMLLASIVLGLGAIVVIVGAPFVVKLLSPGFDNETQDLAIVLLRLLSISISVVGLTVIQSAVLNSIGLFWLPTFSKFIQNMLVLVGVILAPSHLTLYGAVVGFVLGELCRCGVLYFVLAKHHIRLHLDVRVVQEPEVRRLLLALMIPILAFSLRETPLFIERAIASHLPEGSLSALGYAYRLVFAFTALASISISAPVLYRMSSLASKLNTEQVYQTLFQGIKAVTVASIPLSLTVLVIGSPIIRLLLERGGFTSSNTTMVVSAMNWYLLGANFALILPLAMNTFYSLEDWITPLKGTAGFCLLYALLAFLLSNTIGYLGLPVALSLGLMVASIYLVGLVLFRSQRKIKSELGLFFLMLGFCSAGLLATEILTHRLLRLLFEDSQVGGLLTIIIVSATGIGTYLFLGYLLRFSELMRIFGSVAHTLVSVRNLHFKPQIRN